MLCRVSRIEEQFLPVFSLFFMASVLAEPLKNSCGTGMLVTHSFLGQGFEVNFKAKTVSK